ncbi:MAG TPA: flagellar assembly protein FliX [Stellaceae bacterium]|nr:flagellar assembly protein FliX [Stellaceae bacterium]
MRIESTPPLRRTAPVRRDARVGAPQDGPFAAALSGEQPPAPAAAPATVSALDALLTVQEIPDATAGRRRAVQRGEALLDRLEDVRLALLTGVLPRERLEELSRLARTNRAAITDPRLSAILDDIDLRVAVELAKLDQIGQKSVKNN